jgi:hypothetical protein
MPSINSIIQRAQFLYYSVTYYGNRKLNSMYKGSIKLAKLILSIVCCYLTMFTRKKKRKRFNYLFFLHLFFIK